ncbi:MAG: acyltransferase family protein [Aerococcaceae bacterium]|nr:acyltransferase family protein [Aerococcaceae bacterium]
MSVKQRNHHLDNIKVVLIALVVLGHLIEPLIHYLPLVKTLYLAIYTVHMPCFVFISGFFAKKSSSNQVRKLITQYVIFQSVYLIFAKYVLNVSDTVMQFTTPYWLLWFLLALIVWRSVAPALSKLRFPVIFTVMLALLIGFESTVGYYLSLSRIIVFLPFFMAGYTFKPAYFGLLNKPLIKMISLVSLVIVTGVIYWNVASINPSYLYHSVGYQALELSFLNGVWLRGLLFFIGFVLSFALISLVPRQHIPFVSSGGSQTFNVYILHGFIVRWLVYRGFFGQFYSSKQALILIPLAILLCYLLSSRMLSRMVSYLSNPNLSFLYKE